MEPRKSEIYVRDNNNYQYFILRRTQFKIYLFLEVRILLFAMKTMVILRWIDKFT
jgi:hypothetical protein